MLLPMGYRSCTSACEVFDENLSIFLGLTMHPLNLSNSNPRLLLVRLLKTLCIAVRNPIVLKNACTG